MWKNGYFWGACSDEQVYFFVFDTQKNNRISQAFLVFLVFKYSEYFI